MQDLNITEVLRAEKVAKSANLEGGAYDMVKGASPALAKNEQPVFSVLSGIQPLNAFINNIAHSIISGLPQITKGEDRLLLRSTLRSCIDTLEDLYMRV